MSPLPCRTQRGDDAGVAVPRSAQEDAPRSRTRLGAIVIAQHRRIAPGAPTKKARSNDRAALVDYDALYCLSLGVASVPVVIPLACR